MTSVREPDDWLPAIVGRIVRLVDPVRIVLFGSRAHGEARSDSDYDLLVVLDQFSNLRQTRIAIRRALSDLPIAKDIVVASEADMESNEVRPRGIIDCAAQSGQTIYERRVKARSRLVHDLEAILTDEDEMIPLPPEWQVTFWGDPMPNVVAAVRRSRNAH